MGTTYRVACEIALVGIFVTSIVSVMDYAPWSRACVRPNQCKDYEDVSANPLYQTTSMRTGGDAADGMVEACLDLSLWNFMATSNNKYGTRADGGECKARVTPRGESEAWDSSIFSKRDRLINTGELFSDSASGARIEFELPAGNGPNYASPIEEGPGKRDAVLDWVELASCKELVKEGGLACKEKHDLRTEIALAQVGAVLFVAAALRLTLAFVFPKHRWDICLMGGGYTSPAHCERGMAALFALGCCLGLVPIAIWFALVHPGLTKLTELQQAANQNSFDDVELGYGSIMFITAYAAFFLLGSVVGCVMYGRMRDGEQAYGVISASSVGGAKKSIYFSSR
tara:strand:+ start:12262 stop:13287 length:1026 start_codon:yes stop_codon:yes gene_type:complete